MRNSLAWRVCGSIPFLLLLSSSCEAFYDLSTEQCNSNDDCVARFGLGYSCDVGLCKPDDSNEAGSSGKGGGGKSGSSGATAGSTADAGEGGTNGGTGATAGTAGSAGTGGTPPMAECTTHKECFELYPDDSEENPRACVDGACVPLITPECPAVLPISDNGKWNLLKSTNAIVLGAFAPFINNRTTMTTFGNNYDLAVSELSKTTGGVFAGNVQRNQVVVVLCDMFYESQDQLLVPAKHLMEELKVPGVVSALLLQDQSYIWENVARDSNTFMMMPLYSDQALIDENDDGRIWHMLSGANALSVSYQPLLDMTEKHIRALGDLGMTDDLKVAHVKATDEPFLQDTASFLEKNLSFNGQDVGDNLDADLYEPIDVTSIYSAPADKQETAIARILTFGPHIVLGTTSSEMLKYIIPGVEKDWDTQHPGRARPFYLLGALDYNDPAMAPMIAGDTAGAPSKPLFQRVLGVNWPAAVDNSVYEAYQDRWKAKYGGREEGYENFYDGMYYLLYGLAAVRPPLTDGRDIALGMKRITKIGSKIPQVEVGPTDDMSKYVTALKDASTEIELVGTMGPPNWDVNGARNDPASVWCVNAVGFYKPDQLRFDSSDSSLKPSDDTIPNSTITCFDFPKE